MTSDDETPPSPPSRRHRRRSKKAKKRKRSSSSSSSEAAPRKSLKVASRLSTKNILKLFKNLNRDTSKKSFNNNNLNNVVPEFDPANRVQTIECWLRKVNECAYIYDWDEKQTVHFSLQKLVGLAKKWFEALPTVVFTWEEWQNKLRKAFPSEENYGRLLEEMLNRTSRSDESLREYFYDKLSLLNRCEITGKKAVDCVIYGISDRAIRNGAQALNSSEPEDLLNFLSSQKPQSYTLSKIRDLAPQKPSNVSSNSNISTNHFKSITCFNCRAKGHSYYNCPKPILRCKRCNRVGHDNDGCNLEPYITTVSSNT